MEFENFVLAQPCIARDLHNEIKISLNEKDKIVMTRHVLMDDKFLHSI